MNWKKLFIFFSVIWFAINVLQALFTEVMNDEVYYALWGTQLAWGYFDHPPMVGLMTYLSDLLFNGNLSVRFMTIVCQFATLLVMWKLPGETAPDRRKVTLFFVLAASMVMFSAYGFTTAPDVPFLFFTALFLLFYKRFLQHETWFNALLLGVSMAGLIYSKYHGFLIIGFVLLSNWRLILRPKMWFAVALAVFLLLPHIYWQISMDFPSIKYHLNDRSRSFRWGYFFEFIPNQLVVFNPVTLGAVIYCIIKRDYKNRQSDFFERSLLFIIVGLIAFFWLSCFRGHVEPHWTVAATIPMVILVYKRCLIDEKLSRYVKRFVAPSILLILIVRIILCTNLLPAKLGFWGKEKIIHNIEQAAGALPVVFTGSFQQASSYQYFTKHEALLLSGVDSRQTQFDIWQKELKYQGKTVFIFRGNDENAPQFDINGYLFHGYTVEHFQSANRVKIDFRLSADEISVGDTLKIGYEMTNSSDFDIDFNHPELPLTLRVAFDKNRQMQRFDCPVEAPLSVLKARTCILGTLQFVVPDVPVGEYKLALSLENKICPSKNSNFAAIKITEK